MVYSHHGLCRRYEIFQMLSKSILTLHRSPLATLISISISESKSLEKYSSIFQADVAQRMGINWRMLSHWSQRSSSSSAMTPQPEAESLKNPVSGDEQLTLGPDSSCWSCKHRFKKGGVVCTGCEKIQPLDTSLNYFELLGM